MNILHAHLSFDDRMNLRLMWVVDATAVLPQDVYFIISHTYSSWESGGIETDEWVVETMIRAENYADKNIVGTFGDFPTTETWTYFYEKENRDLGVHGFLIQGYTRGLPGAPVKVYVEVGNKIGDWIRGDVVDPGGGSGYVSDLPKTGDRPLPPSGYGVDEEYFKYAAKFSDGTDVYTALINTKHRWTYYWEGNPESAPSGSGHLLQYRDFADYPPGNKSATPRHVGHTIERWQWTRFWPNLSSSAYDERPNIDDRLRHEVNFLNPAKGPRFFEPWFEGKGVYTDVHGWQPTDVFDPRWPQYAANYGFDEKIQAIAPDGRELVTYEYPQSAYDRFPYGDSLGKDHGEGGQAYWGWEFANGYRVFYCDTLMQWYVYPNADAYMAFLNWRNWFTGKIRMCITTVVNHNDGGPVEDGQYLQPIDVGLYYVYELLPFLNGGAQFYESGKPAFHPIYDFANGKLANLWYNKPSGGFGISGQNLGYTDGIQFSFYPSFCNDEVLYNYYYPENPYPPLEGSPTYGHDWFTDLDKRSCMMVAPYHTKTGTNTPMGVEEAVADAGEGKLYDSGFVRKRDSYGTHHFDAVYKMPAYKMIDKNYAYQSPWGYGTLPGYVPGDGATVPGEPIIPRIADGTMAGSAVEDLVRFE